MSKPTDKQIADMLANPAERYDGFRLMVEKYSSRLYWQIRHIVVSHDDANDILQDTLLKAWNCLDRFRGDSLLSTWLYRIAANESLTFLRKRSNTVSLESEDFDMAQQLECDPWFDGDETDRQLQAAIATLPDKQRQVFTLRYYDEMKYEEMSEVLQTSVGALKASYHIASQKIEDYFKQHD